VARPKSLREASTIKSVESLNWLIEKTVSEAELYNERGQKVDGRGYDAVALLAQYSLDNRLKPELRIRAAEIVARYTRPQLQSLQLSGRFEQRITVRTRSFEPGEPDRVICGRHTKPLPCPDCPPDLRDSDENAINVTMDD